MTSREYAEELKHKIIILLGPQINFNNEFLKNSSKIKNQEDNLLSWLIAISEGKIEPKAESMKKEEIIFIKKIGSSNRCIVLKEKNGVFRELHLGDHKYYDFLRKRLGL